MTAPALAPSARINIEIPRAPKPPRFPAFVAIGWLIAAAALVASPFIAGGALPLLLILVTGRA